MKFLLPKEPAFRENFEAMSGCLHEITAIFREFVDKYRDFDLTWQRSKEIEHKADEIAHNIITLLNRSFITPFDREDIYELIHEFDDIIDLLENTIHNIYLYEVPVKKPFMDEFSVLIGKATVALTALIDQTFEHQKLTEPISKLIREIHDLEDDGDNIYHRELRNLLNVEKDPVLIIKWKDILGTVERIMDVYQNISNTVEGIIVKSS
jgi:predicted phosphate transport protein (TIGR00153 family)